MEFDGIGMGVWISFGGEPAKPAVKPPDFKPLDPTRAHSPDCPCRQWYGDAFDKSAQSTPSVSPPKQSFMQVPTQGAMVAPKTK